MLDRQTAPHNIPEDYCRTTYHRQANRQKQKQAHAAYALASQGLAGEIVLIDIDREKAAAQVLDIGDAVAYLPYPVKIKAGDYKDAGDGDVMVIAVGTNPDKAKGETRMDTLAATDVYKRQEDVPRWENFNETFRDKPTVQQKELMRWNTAQLTWKDWQKVIAAYWGYCSYLDSLVGKIMSKLEHLGLAEDTMVVFSTDLEESGREWILEAAAHRTRAGNRQNI